MFLTEFDKRRVAFLQSVERLNHLGLPPWLSDRALETVQHNPHHTRVVG